MSVTIEWTQRTAGRYPGEQETVELTTFVEGCLKQGRAFIVTDPEPATPPVAVFPEEPVVVPEVAAVAAAAAPSVEEVMLSSAVQAEIHTEVLAEVAAALDAPSVAS